VSAAFHSVIRFQVKPGREADFEAAFRDAGMLTRPRAVPGYLGADLVRSADATGEYLVLGRWTSAEAYAAWQAIAAQDAPREALRRLVDTLVDPAPGRGFVTVQAGN
jgi:heme-degrading monooxygenase HmoA